MKFFVHQPQDDDKVPTTPLGIRKKAKGLRQKLDKKNLPSSTQENSPKSTCQCDSTPKKVKVIRVKKDRCPVPVGRGTLRHLIAKFEKGKIWHAPNDGTDLGPNDIRNSIRTIESICSRRSR